MGHTQTQFVPPYPTIGQGMPLICDAPSWGSDTNLSRPDPDSTGMADPNRVRSARLYTGTLIDLFFLRAEFVPVGIQTIYVITKIIYIYKRTTTGVVSIKIYTHILSPIYTCTFAIEYIL